MTMGLIRGTLHIASYGLVSPKSKKQRMASMQLAAMQGKSEAEVRIAGSRNFDSVNRANIRARQQRELRAAERANLAGFKRQIQARQQAETAQDDTVSELERLAALHQSGALDDEEFRAAKVRIIGVANQVPLDAPMDIRTRIAALRETVEAEIAKALERKAQILAGDSEPDLPAVESINKQLITLARQRAELEQLEQQIER